MFFFQRRKEEEKRRLQEEAEKARKQEERKKKANELMNKVSKTKRKFTEEPMQIPTITHRASDLTERGIQPGGGTMVIPPPPPALSLHHRTSGNKI